MSNYGIKPGAGEILKEMTLDEKIGQLTQPAEDAITEAQITDFHIGAIQGAFSDVRTPKDPRRLARKVRECQRAALRGRFRIPLLYGMDAPHGHSVLPNATIFPHAIGLSATNDLDLMKKVASQTADELIATGINHVFGPYASVVRDQRWGRSYECYGNDPKRNQQLLASFISGLQRKRDDTFAVIGSAKHFIADSGAEFGSSERFYIEQGDVKVGEKILRDIYLPPFITAIEAGIGAVIVSPGKVDGLRMHCHHHLISNILKGELGFDGFVMSDWAGIETIPGSYYEQIVKAINSGIDMFMVVGRYLEFITNLKKAVHSGDVSEGRINDAVRRILGVKEKFGLLENPEKALPEDAAIDIIGSDTHRLTARQAVRKSLVLLKNESGLLPVKGALKILVTGKNAHDLGNQCGGWTLSNLGESGNHICGTTILEAIQSRAALDSSTITYVDSRGDKIVLEVDSAEATTDESCSLTRKMSQKNYSEFIFDIEESRLIQGIGIKWTPMGFSKYFIEFSNDQVNWQQVAYKNCFQEEKCHFAVEPTATRYVRIRGEEWNNPDKKSCLDTLELFEFHKTRIADAALQADCAIVVFGETPYGEGIGDVVDNRLQPDDVATLDALKEKNIPVIAVLVSGRVLVLDHHVNKMDALVAAWLPGSEGGGVSDVLFGDYDFEGTLPVAWPGLNNDLPAFNQ